MRAGGIPLCPFWGSHDHPEYRAELTVQRTLFAPGAFDHPTRAFLALTMAMRYEAESNAPYLETARALGCTIKLLSICERLTNDEGQLRVSARVYPALVPLTR